MRKISVVVIACIVLSGLLAAAVLFIADRAKPEESVQIRTDTQPIYNHFPDLPETSEIQWCSWSSSGIGLTTVKIYIFAFYDHDVSNELQDMEIENQSEDIELYFVPDGVNGDEKWRRVESIENLPFPLQTGVRESARFTADVYINEAGTILYIEGIGD